jgi:hypothetical protein
MAADRTSGKKANGSSGVVAMAAVFGMVTILAIGAGWFVGTQIRSVTQAQTDGPAGSGHGLAAGSDKDAAALSKNIHASGHASRGDKSGETAASEAESSILSSFSHPTSVKLQPIVSNIGTSGDEWMRLEVAVIFGSDAGSIADTEKDTISEAIVAMLRRMDKETLAGPSGFLQFREDLDDTVMISTGGRANSAKILSMVVE